MSSAVRFWLCVLLLAVGAYGGYTFWKISKLKSANRGVELVSRSEPLDESLQPKSHEGSADRGEEIVTRSDSPGEIENLSLTMQTGELFQFMSLKGKVWVGSLFYTLCPSECKLQNEYIAQLRKQLADADLTWISITCDPEMDTPSVLKEYAKRFDADPRTWKFLTGSEGTIRKVAVDYFKVPFARQSHSARLILIDRDGKVVDRYSVFDARDVARIKEKVRELVSKSSDKNAGEDEPKLGEKEAVSVEN
jgi:protein SCO1/2